MEPTLGVRELAEREGYGELLAMHRVPLRSVLSPIGLFLLPVAVLATVLACTDRYDVAARSAGACLALGCVALAALAVRRDVRAARRTDVVSWFAEGLVIDRTGGLPTAHGWDVINPYEFTISVSNGRSRGGSSTVRTIRLLELRDPDGVPVLAVTGREQTARFAALLAARQLPAAGARLAAGEAVEFGPFTVSRDGLSLNGEAHPWRQVRALRVTAHRVLLELSSGEVRYVATRDVPHLRTLEALARERVGVPD
ncbi:DUF6585 family protein [Kitasatospora griseola]|uniref:DUF6585 family protein n=1 Tax=Kitasatospora griseola TaxID=2064 RepID=UPI0038303F50